MSILLLLLDKNSFLDIVGVNTIFLLLKYMFNMSEIWQNILKKWFQHDAGRLKIKIIPFPL